jgi:hypothetical protein
MQDFWNDPPETPEPPECCGDYMDVDEKTGACSCPKCGKRIEPPADIGPDPEPEVSEAWPPDDLPPEPVTCPHGNKPSECNDCCVASDFAYDAARGC